MKTLKCIMQNAILSYIGLKPRYSYAEKEDLKQKLTFVNIYFVFDQLSTTKICELMLIWNIGICTNEMLIIMQLNKYY